MSGLVTLQPHVIQQKGLPCRLPQDRIFYDGKHIGYVGTHRSAGVNFITHKLPDSIKHQVKLVVAERDAREFGTDKLQEYERLLSQPPPPEDNDDE